MPDVVLGDRGPGKGDQDQQDDEGPAADRDLVAPEPAPDELPVPAGADRLDLAERPARLGRYCRAEPTGAGGNDDFLFATSHESRVRRL